MSTFAPGDLGVCWADIKNAAARLCIACPDGQVCAQRYDEQLVCVSESVCQALWDLGASSVCRYADKVHYDHRAVPKASGCPNTGVGYPYCGGDCPPCKSGYGCTGRSPDHPFGICVHMSPKGDLVDEPCSFGGPGPIIRCEWNQFNHSACGIFTVPVADAPAARHYGICLEVMGCLQLGAALPGGFTCLDKFGDAIRP